MGTCSVALPPATREKAPAAPRWVALESGAGELFVSIHAMPLEAESEEANADAAFAEKHDFARR